MTEQKYPNCSELVDKIFETTKGKVCNECSYECTQCTKRILNSATMDSLDGGALNHRICRSCWDKD